jgi:hypothetical protein
MENYLNVSGLKSEANLAPIYAKYGHLFERESIAEIKDRRRSASGEEERKLRYIQGYLTTEYLLSRSSALLDELNTMESKMVVKVDGEEIAYRELGGRIRDEGDRDARGRIYAAYSAAVGEFNPWLKKLVLGLREASRELGYVDYVALYENAHGIDLVQLQSITERLTKETDSLYAREMWRAVRERLGLELERVEPHDMYRFYRAPEFDEHFPREGMIPALRGTLADMGIDLGELGNIHIEAGERPGKAGSYYFGVRVPQDIRLVVMPVGGYRGYQHLFHEVGHVLFCGFTDAVLDFEYRCLADKSLSEGYAMLFGNLLTNGRWLRRYVKMGDASDYLDFQYMAHRLSDLRGWCAALSYEVLLHAKGPEGMDGTYREISERVNLMKADGNMYLVDDHWLDSAEILRACFFEAQLRATLEDRFGHEWFGDRGAGLFLRGLWSEGGSYGVDEVVRRLGYGGLDPKPLMDDVRDRFL